MPAKYEYRGNFIYEKSTLLLSWILSTIQYTIGRVKVVMIRLEDLINLRHLSTLTLGQTLKIYCNETQVI